MAQLEAKEKWISGILLFLLAGAFVKAYNASTTTVGEHVLVAVEAFFVVRYALKLNRNLGLLALFVVSIGYPLLLAANHSNSPATAEACEEYERAFVEEPDLDPAGTAVLQALDSAELDNLDRDFENSYVYLEENFPDTLQKLSEGPWTEEYLAELSPDARQAAIDFGLKFAALHEGITTACSAATN